MTISGPEAPRFHAYFQHLEGRRVLLMSRQVWEQMKAHHAGGFVEIDILLTPIASITNKSQFIASVGKRRSDYEAVIEVYRLDPKDDPNPINVDRYLVWEHLPPHRDYLQLVNTASTEDNANMRDFVKHYVYIVQEPPGPDHRLSELPDHCIKARLKSLKSLKSSDSG